MRSDRTFHHPLARRTRGGRRGRERVAALAAGALVAVSALAAGIAPAQAGEVLRVGSWDYPADLHDLATDSLGQTFELPAGAELVDTVGGVFANYGQTGSGLTLTLRATGPGGTVLDTEVFTNIRDNAWVELSLDAPLGPGTYYLEATDAVGLVAWWSNTPNVYAGGTAYEDGAPVAGDRTVVARNTVPVPVDPPVAQPGFTDGVANGMTFESEGFTLRRDDLSGFSYDYAPSVIVEDGVEKMWWCGHNVNGDGVYYSQRDQPDGAWSEPDLVLSADRAWEVVHVCDPSVIRGSFSVDGVGYSYLMYYGAADLSGQNTKLGVAYSNDGVTWVKHSDEALLEEPGMIFDYGVGMPALFTMDGDVYVAYYDTGRNSAPIVRAVNADGTLGADVFMLALSGGDTFADLAFSPAEQVWYATTKSQLPGLSDEETYVYRSRTADLRTTDWVFLGMAGEWLTGFPRNHNAGWYRTADGSLYEPGGVKRLVFGAQDGGQGTTDPDKWDLATVAVSGTPDAAPAPGALALSTPADASAVDPLDVNGFSWSASAGATSYVLKVGTDPSLSSDTVELSTTVHATSAAGLDPRFATGSMTQRMSLQPDTTYYWSVTAVSPGGVAEATDGPFSFRTTPSYALDLDAGSYVHWSTLGDARFTPGPVALLELPTAASGLRTGADYNPLRADLSGLDGFEFTFAGGSDPGGLGDLVLTYKLQSDARDEPAHTVTADIAAGLDGDVLTVDMTGQPGWGVAGERIALLTIQSSAPGTLQLAGLRLTATCEGGPATIVFGGQDSGVPNYDRGDRCTFTGLVAAGGPYAGHGALVRAVRVLTEAWRAEGLFTRAEAQRVQVAASRSNLGG
ncbi:hypothetical protein SAMN04488561_0866 [Jiangella alba]|uniref:Fibronectin type-III domain-containing protein n=1 Tax=Jiangella alba TaxID=561176 RepID=A0A1H5HIN1_9ACTN|nr:hypothetical protein SAMN04488561_0866 [Jiangella alba]